MRSKFIFSFFAFVASIAVAWTVSAFSVSKSNDAISIAAKAVEKKNLATNYWVYQPTSTGFKDTAKYTIVSLDAPGDQNCPAGTTRPCVLTAATGSMSTKAQLHTYLQAFTNDAAILAASATQKGN